MKIPSNMKSLVAILRSNEIAAEIEAYCDASPDILGQIRLIESTVADAPSIINGGADIVVIETGDAAQTDITALEQLCAYVSRGGSFIVIMNEPSSEVMRRLFRAGVTDVLSTPVNAAELAAALNAAHGRKIETPAQAASASGKIITVVKTAGGVGATTLAANLGGALASMVEGKVALVDLDIQFGQIATALDVRPRMTVLDAVRAGARLDPILLASTFTEHDSGLQILAAPGDITPLEAVTDQFIDRLFMHLRAVAAVSIIEVPAAWTQWIGNALDKSDRVIPVAEASVRSAAGAARINQSFIDFGLTGLNLHLIVNKYEKTIENNERAKRIGDIFLARPAGVVRLDVRTAQDAADRGLLFSAVSQKSLAAKDIETNARNIAGALGLSVRSEPAAAPPLARILGGRTGSRGRAQ
ncbi:MAG: hypothetical protein A3E78_06420 [Alphaproteobacteria bacterium RIFCSPHIGHO2_12_FULL_63_12]|nr:MAG: hypothetical protein A3E78_06420 [Alphaproteobacteria bacterium RIFCSPHIGHO2_12_FULL_63_12]